MIYPVTDKPHKKRIIILGGGFGGVYAAIHLEKLLARVDAVEICLISHDNFFLFTPMLHEIAASDLEITNIVNPLRKLLRKVEVLVGDVNENRSAKQAGLDFTWLPQTLCTDRLRSSGHGTGIDRQLLRHSESRRPGQATSMTP